MKLVGLASFLFPITVGSIYLVYTMQEPSRPGRIIVVSIWFWMIFTQIINIAYKDSLTSTYSSNNNIWLVLQFWYWWYRYTILLLMLNSDTVQSLTYHTNINVSFIITYARAESCIINFNQASMCVGVHHEPKLQSQTSKGWCRMWLFYNVHIPNSCHDSLCRSRTCHTIKGNYKLKNAHVYWELNGCDLNIMFLF